ncbi:MAG: superoxide dismutase family protein [Lachnospira sp.]|nr:superoxide dismutase family protein [Lachnospira sp.]
MKSFKLKSLFYFPITDIIGRSVIIHENSDDFTPQPAGNSGIKKRLRRYLCLLIRIISAHIF